MRGRGALSPPTARCGGSSAGTPPRVSKHAARRPMQVFLFNMAPPPPPHTPWLQFFLALVRSWESHLPVNGLPQPHDMEGGLLLSPLSQGVACSLRVDRRQDPATSSLSSFGAAAARSRFYPYGATEKAGCWGAASFHFSLHSAHLLCLWGTGGRVSSCESVLVASYSSSGTGLHLLGDAIGL